MISVLFVQCPTIQTSKGQDMPFLYQNDQIEEEENGHKGYDVRGILEKCLQSK